jgi:HAD superfamily hydrolase (TIGR01490 family)
MTAKPFAVFDVDGTLIRWQMFHAIVDELGHQGYLDPKTHAAIKVARMDWKSRKGEESFKVYEAQLVESFLQLLTKISVEEYDIVVHTVFDKYKDQVYRYTRGLIQELKSKDYLLFAVSGSGHETVSLVAKYYGFDDWFGTVYEQKGGRFTGNVEVAVHQKPKLLRALVEKHGATFEGSIGVGDSEGDIEMLNIVEQPIAFNPSKKLFRHASAEGWHIVLERKNMVYELGKQGNTYQLTETNADKSDDNG